MKSDAEIREALKRLCAPPVQCLVAIVDSVDEENYTIDVKPVGGAVLFEVRLKAAINDVKDGIVEIPEVGSSVIIGLLGNDKNTAFVLKTDKVKQVIINGGENGGLTITPKLKEELDKTNALLEALIQVINGTPVTEPGNGSPSALQQALSGAISGKQLGDYAEIENNKVVH